MAEIMHRPRGAKKFSLLKINNIFILKLVKNYKNVSLLESEEILPKNPN
jgi:hypothetical protein